MQFGPRVDIPYTKEAGRYMKIIAPIVITVATVLYLTGFPWLDRTPSEPIEPSKLEMTVDKETCVQPIFDIEQPQSVYKP